MASPELRELRRAAAQAFVEQGWPGPGIEGWKYTSLRGLKSGEFVLPQADAALAITGADLDIPLHGQSAGRIVLINGVFNAALSDLQSLPEGVLLAPLSSALGDDGLEQTWIDLWQQAWSGRGDALASLNTALAQQGMVLRVAAGVQVDKPIHLLNLGLAGEPRQAINLRHQIVMQAGSQASIAQQHMSEPGSSHWWNEVTQIQLAEDAQLHHLQLQTLHADASQVTRSHVSLQRGAGYRSWSLDFGARLARHDQRIALSGEHSQAQVDGVFIGDGRRHIDNQVEIDHRTENCTSSQTWRGVLRDRARGVYNGRVVVQPGADGTDARQSSANLLLSPHAEIDTKPELEIYAEDVRCAHGATVGQLDRDQLFYLKSRGIPHRQAYALLIEAFCSAVLEGMHSSLTDLASASLHQALLAPEAKS